ncbi:MAG: energy-coupling factor transporter transmembrane component T, partial [Nitrospirota bacterium]|nr:energy-coupling factor transporter transmembrane component T [Nitrospirota bacterium]
FRWVGILLGAGVGIIQAQRSRGLDITSGTVIERIRKYVPLVVPLIGHALRQTNLLAMALESKGFHPMAQRSFYETGKLKRSDYAMLLGVFLLLTLSGWLRWQGIGTLAVRF